jgi:hypothetical protein
LKEVETQEEKDDIIRKHHTTQKHIVSVYIVKTMKKIDIMCPYNFHLVSITISIYTR